MCYTCIQAAEYLLYIFSPCNLPTIWRVYTSQSHYDYVCINHIQEITIGHNCIVVLRLHYMKIIKIISLISYTHDLFVWEDEGKRAYSPYNIVPGNTPGVLYCNVRSMIRCENVL